MGECLPYPPPPVTGAPDRGAPRRGECYRGRGEAVDIHDQVGDGPDGPRSEGPASRVERQWAATQAVTHVGSWEWDARTGAVRWSDELYRIHGLAPGAAPVTFDSALDRVHPDDRGRVVRDVRVALEHGMTFAYCARIVRPDGAVREIETTGEPTRDRTRPGRRAHRDVPRHDRRARREEQLQLYADVAQNVQLGLSVWSVGETGEEGDAVLLVFNPASEAIARMPLAPFVGKTLRETVPYAAGGKLEAIIAQVARDGQVHEAVGAEFARPEASRTARSPSKRSRSPGGAWAWRSKTSPNRRRRGACRPTSSASSR